MFFYKAYGLSFRSEMYLPELISGGDGKDVLITFDDFIPNQITNNINLEFGFNVKTNKEEIYLSLNDVNIFKISHGSEIVINPKTNLDYSYLKIIILGSAMSYLLHQRGDLILHSSAVNINGSAVAFLGGNGMGKSTTSFLLYNKGYPLITDDLLSIDMDKENGLPWVNPGSKRIKLLPEIINHTQEDLNSMQKTHKYSLKYSYCAWKNFSFVPIPLKKIYVLEKSAEWGLTSLSASEALIKIVESSHPYKIFTKNERAKNLIQCSKLLKKVPVKCLKFQRSLDKLPKLIKIIENDCKHS